LLAEKGKEHSNPKLALKSEKNNLNTSNYLFWEEHYFYEQYKSQMHFWWCGRFVH